MHDRQLRFSDVELRYVENTVEFNAFGPVVDELAQDFTTVRITRECAGPMADELFGNAAIIFAVGTASGAFLNELIKDLYKGLKAGLFALYKSAKTWANGRTYWPLAVEMRLESRDPALVFHFSFPQDLEADEFEKAITSIGAALESHSDPDFHMIGFVYDRENGWELDPET